MALPQLNVYRHDRDTRALITLAGEIDLATAPLVREALAECLRDGIRSIDVDLTAVTFCDAGGLNAFLMASRLATDAGRTLRLHHPSQSVARVIEITGSGFLLHSFPAGSSRRTVTEAPRPPWTRYARAGLRPAKSPPQGEGGDLRPRQDSNLRPSA
ncbi:STAS domain-containing protein [Streptomyces spongiae]|uniref:Anti-sigma factor antagonist n=1 Tax=Streptomyces spongiae TaxID=565072 RepID=A0A5N8XFR1_9ACTN|nr:STAS domain-containing protein [Streptomyces spongiae]MPY58350.1 STAS domain-containing protein [Streptomyces spongiae]